MNRFKVKCDSFKYPCIGDSVFYGCEQLSGIVIPKGVVSIGEYAFVMCAIKSVKIPVNVADIGTRAFSDVEIITVDPDNQYYSSDSSGVLFNKDKSCLIQYPVNNKKTNFEVSDSVTDIGDGAFAYCFSLKHITIPNSVTHIDDRVFEECDYLESVTIGNSVLSI